MTTLNEEEFLNYIHVPGRGFNAIVQFGRMETENSYGLLTVFSIGLKTIPQYDFQRVVRSSFFHGVQKPSPEDELFFVVVPPIKGIEDNRTFLYLQEKGKRESRRETVKQFKKESLQEMVKKIEQDTGFTVGIVPEVPIAIQLLVALILSTVLCILNALTKTTIGFNEVGISEARKLRAVIGSFVVHFLLSSLTNRSLANKVMSEKIVATILTTGTSAYFSMILETLRGMITTKGKSRLVDVSFHLLSLFGSFVLFTVFITNKIGQWMIFPMVWLTCVNHPNDHVVSRIFKNNICNICLVPIAVSIPIKFPEFCFQLLPFCLFFTGANMAMPHWLFKEKTKNGTQVRIGYDGEKLYGVISYQTIHGLFHMARVRKNFTDADGRNMMVDGTEITHFEVVVNPPRLDSPSARSDDSSSEGVPFSREEMARLVGEPTARARDDDAADDTELLVFANPRL